MQRVLENDQGKGLDEWYNFKLINVKTLSTLDETNYEGGENGETHLIAWYTSLTEEERFHIALKYTNEEPLFLQHLLGGIKYVMGEANKLK